MEHKSKNFFYKCFLLLFIFSFTNTNVICAFNEPLIRVLIAREKKLRIRSDGSIPLKILDKDFSAKRIKGFTIKKINNKNILFFDKDNEKFYAINNKRNFLVKSSDKRGMWIKGKRYHGKVNLIFLANEILVVNILGIEKYLSSVVGSEMPHKWHIEALKAQAIASRTYALRKKGNELFDLDSTQNDQVYNGLESSTNTTRRAVRKTRSLVMTYKNKLINALFHSSSGGITENSEDVWTNKYAYLRSVKDFDQKNPKVKWQKRFSKNELKNLFPLIGDIQEINIENISNTGRVKTLKITGDIGSKIISGKEFRRKTNLRSTLFRLKTFKDFEKQLNNDNFNSSSDTFLIITGMGSGHGVGMSQWGARYMARRGYKSNQILKHFYKGIDIKPFKNIYK